MTEYHFDKDSTTFGDLLKPAVEIAKRGDHEEGQRWWAAYTRYLVKDWGHSPDKAEQIIRSNVGYWSGYYDHDTMVLIQDFYRVAHPVFGRAT